ncbi:hypothetical protein ACNAW0_13925 [Micromonospora sp. SL1-18]|uniref:hypothetical protein n=1 Tax=Micromonospora sp. SL1-18 TaxID=3399128 RepID=UPI003A4D6F6A
MIKRRVVLQGIGGLGMAGLLARAPSAHADTSTAAIDRRALVGRHDIERTASDPDLPVQVGNGRFAFGADITGLQTFLPFATMSDWGWHEDALPPGQTPADYVGEAWDTHGRPVYYWTNDPAHPQLNQWLRENPHRINLARIGMRLLRSDGQEATEADLTDRYQRLDLWSGTLHSRFVLEGVPVTVETVCHPESDVVAVRVDSPLVAASRLSVFIDFPYATAGSKFSAPFVGVWDRPDAHETQLRLRGSHRADITHHLDATTYHASLVWQEPAQLAHDATRPHRYVLDGRGARRLEVAFGFSPDEPHPAPPAPAVSAVAAEWWPRFWHSGGAIDLSDSADPRWMEFERRIVRSQYTMAVNEAGAWPPQESGLVNNGWYGAFHMEMYWWHAAHYALWNRWPLLDRSLGVYEHFLASARDRARDQGYRGARWPKMTSPEGREAPGQANALLLWQQPHPIFFAELDYRAHPNSNTLAKWREVIFATADFLASYAFYDSATRRYVLGPPLVIANERPNPRMTINPTFELSYCRFALRIAQQWRRRLGLAPDPTYADVLAGLAPLPVQDGVYVFHEGIQDMWSRWNSNHPDPVAAYGMLPGDGVDVPTMRDTAQRVYGTWKMNNLYGWDFALLAMNAARLGDPDRAVDFLLHEQFRFTDTGHPASGVSSVPSPYFPSAGGLLYAAAMMTAGWDGAPKATAPGFPSDGRWTVRSEGLSPAI